MMDWFVTDWFVLGFVVGVFLGWVIAWLGLRNLEVELLNKRQRVLRVYRQVVAARANAKMKEHWLDDEKRRLLKLAQEPDPDLKAYRALAHKLERDNFQLTELVLHTEQNRLGVV